jgi:hypothetical protein
VKTSFLPRLLMRAGIFSSNLISETVARVTVQLQQ